MFIKIAPESKRRVAFTDRRDGYFQYLFGAENPENGYYRGGKRFFSEFESEGHAFCDAKSITVFPHGFSVQFEGHSVEIALLLEEQAFYVSARNSILFKDLLAVQKTPVDSTNAELGSGNGAGSFANTAQNQKIEWHTASQDGTFVVSNSQGFAVAANFEFYHAVKECDVSLYVSNSDGKQKTSSDFTALGWYAVFEESEEAAIQKAVRLAKTVAVKAHKQTVDAFLAKANFDFGDERFNESVQWARFSGWLLATKDHGSSYRGIWAGLPWFRDNWGRDTFISLCGTLLVSGCFDEAKDVLLGFAGFQDTDQNSPTYGRIPNRYRDSSDVIYNTADGTLWFIRALWEYAQYSGDVSVFAELRDTLERALDADMNRCDDRGFLLHADADTWMDARIENNQPWSARGNRANDIQALWFTALRIGAMIEKSFGDTAREKSYADFAAKVKDSFAKYFWNKNCNALADHLPEGGYGEWAKDMRVRPNQLFTVMIPSVLDLAEENYFVPRTMAKTILSNVNRELVNPFGLYSLSPEDPLFHPKHENPAWYHKDAAYHNGTIWEWNSGAYITLCALDSNGVLPSKAAGIIRNYSKMIMDVGCVGSLSENIHARPDLDGNPILSGTFSQAWSVAEFVRNIGQDVIGFVPQLVFGNIKLKPCLPAGCKEIHARLPFGSGWTLDVTVKKKGKNYAVKAIWQVPAESDSKKLSALTINGTAIVPGTPVEFTTLAEPAGYEIKSHVFEKFACPSKWVTSSFEKQKLDNDFCGAEKKKNYLHDLILSGRMLSKCCAGENTAALEWYFDSSEFEKKYATELELGALYSKKSTVFRLWSPTAKAVSVMLYKTGEDSDFDSVPFKTVLLENRAVKGDPGVWEVSVKGDLHGVYYLYKILVHGVEQISCDPYAKACGVNGNCSMVVDLSRTNPQGWQNVTLPPVKTPSDVIAYEAHIADISSSSSWNGTESLRRTFLGACQSGTSVNGVPSGFDHIKSLGITHVQLLPVFDFRTVDEANVNDPELKNRPTFGNFNWGYDPQNYACIEGSYSTNPHDGAVRITEFKKLIQSYAEAGIGVIMDVVYNHVKDGLIQALGTSVPGYFFRVEGYSGAGEDTACERIMFQKYMVDTLSYLLKEYKLAGFRFDLMGLHDLRAMNKIHDALHKIKKDVLLYGEGWDMYRAGKMEGATQLNAAKMPGIGFFNDAVRCGIKGPVFDDAAPGFIHDGTRKESVKFGIVGTVKHPGVDNAKVEGTAAPNPWGEHTWRSVNYTEIHDNVTLRDKIFLVEQFKPEEYYDQMQKMAISLVLLSEGMPILHAGMEFCRSKEVPLSVLEQKPAPVFYDYARSANGKHTILRNSYNACDVINNLDWNRCAQKQDVVQYVRNLIALRKAHPAFRLATGEECRKVLRFIDNKKAGFPEPVLAWELNGESCGDSWKKITIIANPFNSDVQYELPGKGTWVTVTDGIQFAVNPAGLSGSEVHISGGSVVAVQPKAVAIFAEI